MIHQCFIDAGFDKKPEEFFKENASEVVKTLRSVAWDRYIKGERDFENYAHDKAASALDYGNRSQKDSVTYFLSEYSDYVYELFLSKTQSRRARAGKEFEAIIELLFMGAGIELDSQGNIASKFFTEKGLGKSVDLVIPGAIEFEINKRNVMLVSAKTTLRERWQEVAEEMSRTGVSEIYLATLDDNVSDKVLDNLYESNIILVTLECVKREKYSHTSRVITFENLLELAETKSLLWKDHVYTNEQHTAKLKAVKSQLAKHADKDFVTRFYSSIAAGIIDS